MNARISTFIAMIISLCLIPSLTQAQDVSGTLLSRINTLRAEQGLSPYRLNAALNAAAQGHAQWMVDTSQVTHTQDNGSNPQARAQANGYNSQWVSENIYMGGLASVDTAWNFWINSAIHYAGLTSPNYRDIGIATAQGTGGKSYVLVFGVPSGASSTTSSGNSGASGNNQAESPPIAIVGYDEVGNIQYELQAGDTLGQVLLLFGYTWDELNTLMELNEFTEADITGLDVGQIVLVPPPQGTYTPTPEIEETEELTETAVVNDSPQPSVVLPTATATLLPTTELTNTGIIPTPIATAITPAPQAEIATTVPATEAIIEQVGQPVTYVAVTVSATAIPTLQINNVQATATVPAPIVEESPAKNNPRPPTWLIVAIVAQIGILLYASFEYFRRK